MQQSGGPSHWDLFVAIENATSLSEIWSYLPDSAVHSSRRRWSSDVKSLSSLLDFGSDPKDLNDLISKNLSRVGK